MIFLSVVAMCIFQYDVLITCDLLFISCRCRKELSLRGSCAHYNQECKCTVVLGHRMDSSIFVCQITSVSCQPYLCCSTVYRTKPDSDNHHITIGLQYQFPNNYDSRIKLYRYQSVFQSMWCEWSTCADINLGTEKCHHTNLSLWILV